MRPYSVEIFTPRFMMVGCSNTNEIIYKEDYLAPDSNSVTVLTVPGVEKQDYIRISRGHEEYAGVITEVSYGTEKSKRLQTITYKPFMEMFDTKILFDVNGQGKGSLEEYISGQIRELFIENEDKEQNVKGLTVSALTQTEDWSLHITPSDKGGHYNIVNLMDSVIIPAMKKYRIMVRVKLDIQNRAIRAEVGVCSAGVIIIESDLPNILKKNVVVKQTNMDVNKLVLYDSADYVNRVTYYLHTDLSYDRQDTDRIVPVLCERRALTAEEGRNFDSAAIAEASSVFGNLSFSNLIELTMSKEDSLVHPMDLSFGQMADIISEGTAYRSILTGWEIGNNIKLIFGTVRLDLTKILRRNENGR